jgi:hypothetical protein
LDFACVEEDTEVWDGEVAKQGAGVGGDDGEVRVIAFEGREEGVGNGICGVAGKSGGRVEIFYCCLRGCQY